MPKCLVNPSSTDLTYESPPAKQFALLALKETERKRVHAAPVQYVFILFTMKLAAVLFRI